MYSENKTLTPTCIIYVDGERLDWKYEGALESVKVSDRLNETGTASLLFGMPAGEFDGGGAFSEGSEVSVCLGYKDDMREAFAGEVTGISPRFGERAAPQTEVRLETRLRRLKKERRARSFENKTPAQTIREIISSHGLCAEVEEFGPVREYTEQNNATDWEYLMRLANRYGKAVYCQGRTVYVRTEITPTDDEVVLEKGKGIITASARTSLKGQLSLATCTGWDMLECRGFSATATMKDLPLKVGGECSWEDNSRGFDPNRSERLTSEEPADEDDARALAQAVMLDRSLRFQRCEVKTQGNGRIKPGNRLTVKYLGEMFSGEYMVFAVTHTLSAGGGFVTECALRRNFCEVSNRSGTASEIDRERADSQINGTQEENAVAVSSLSSGKQSENQGDSENTSNEKTPKITNPHWENADGQTITKALVGDEVYLCADVTDIDDGATAKIKIVEKDDDGNDDDLTTLTDKVQDGKIRCDWKVIYTEDNDDTESQKELEEKGYTLPEYAFTVECEGVKSEESGQLDVMGWIKTRLINELTGMPLINFPYKIFDIQGKLITSGKTSNQGFIDFDGLDVSLYDIELEI